MASDYNNKEDVNDVHPASFYCIKPHTSFTSIYGSLSLVTHISSQKPSINPIKYRIKVIAIGCVPGLNC